MATKTHRSEMVLPSTADLLTYTKEVERRAQLARSEAAHALITAAARKVRTTVRHWADVVSFAQRANQQARL